MNRTRTLPLDAPAAWARLAVLAWSTALAAGCPVEPARPIADPGPPRRWHYEVTLDAELAEAHAEVCFEGAPPRELRAGNDAAAIYLQAPRWQRPGPARKLPMRDGKIQLAGMPADGCVAYTVDLARAAGQPDRLAARLGDDLLATPSLWLWRPDRRHPKTRASLRLRLPKGMRASLPWPSARDGRHWLDAADFRFVSYAAFGHFQTRERTVQSARVEVSAVGGATRASPDALADWVTTTARTVAAIPGRFPTRRLQVIVAGVEPTSEPVLFGTVGRGGGSSVLVFASADATLDALRRDWVLPHELSHLYLPFVRREDAWLPEGFATYYQEVLRVRAGAVPERDAWQTLVDAARAADARATGRSMQAESAAMTRTHEYKRVYWGGAAFAVIADARLRERSGGESSLDASLRRAFFDTEPARRTYSAADVLAALDEASGHEVFRELSAECLTRDTLPPLSPTLEKLGVRVVEGRVQLDDDAPWASTRRAIMAGPRAAP